MFTTHLLFNAPRLRFSKAQKTAVLKWGKDLHAVGVPSLGGLKKCQDRIESLIGHPTTKATSSSGDVFYLNDIGSAIAKVINWVECIPSHSPSYLGLLESSDAI